MLAEANVLFMGEIVPSTRSSGYMQLKIHQHYSTDREEGEVCSFALSRTVNSTRKLFFYVD